MKLYNYFTHVFNDVILSQLMNMNTRCHTYKIK